MARIIEFYVPAKFQRREPSSRGRRRQRSLCSAPKLRTLHSPQCPSFTRPRSCALRATMIVERFIAIAPTLMGRLTPHRVNIPAAAGIAIT
jgi:hypothetical protein